MGNIIKIGDIVICINNEPLFGNTSAPPLRLNSEYVVQNMYVCPKCTMKSFDVGLGKGNVETLGTKCCTEIIPMKEIWWCASQRFVKKQTKKEQLAEAIKNENYELAAILNKE